MGNLFFISGGARSGKSGFAETRALQLADELSLPCVAYLATGVAMDPEFAARIAHHRQSRDSRFATVEESLDLARGLRAAFDKSPLVLLECISTWLGNVFHHMTELDREPFALAQVDAILALLAQEKNATLFLVTNEVGLGIVPADAYTRQYRDIHGRVNHRLAAASDEAWLLMSGLPLRLR